jgi:hypothetical protein
MRGTAGATRRDTKTNVRLCLRKSPWMRTRRQAEAAIGSCVRRGFYCSLMKRVVAVGMLSSAFAPLIGLLAVIQAPSLGRGIYVVFAVCALSLLLLAIVLREVARIQEVAIRPKQVRRADEKVLAFASSYIVPVAIAAFGKGDAATLAGTLALVVFLAFIYVRGEMYHLNPTLAICGYHLYEVTATNDTVTMVLSRKAHLPQTEVIRARSIGEYVAIQTGDSS